MAKVTFSTKVSGPFFELGGQPLKDAGADMIQDLLKEGEAYVEMQLTPGHGVRTGQYKSGVHQAFVRTKRWGGGGLGIGWGKVSGIPERKYWSGGRNEAIIGYWLEGAARKGQATRFKGYHMFRKATQHLRRLANQIAGKQYKKAVQRLT